MSADVTLRVSASWGAPNRILPSMHPDEAHVRVLVQPVLAGVGGEQGFGDAPEPRRRGGRAVGSRPGGRWGGGEEVGCWWFCCHGLGPGDLVP
jgi:hypothetical protein